jgi:hypothetical protein
MTAGRSDWLFHRRAGLRATAAGRIAATGRRDLACQFARFWPFDPSKLAKSITSAQAEALENTALSAFFTAD